MKKGQISNILRALGLIYFTDWLRFHLQKLKNRKKNRDFKSRNPDVKLPPDYLIYESFQIDYQKYYSESFETAKWLKDHFKKHIDLSNIRILDWGCGPGRIIRHLPKIINKGCEFYATDYNKQSIEWCSKNIEGIKFNKNSIEADLPYENEFIDLIYGLSIFTHLSEESHFEWFRELYRVLKPNGIMFLTSQGDNFKVKLTDSELSDYNKNQLVVRGKVKEGHRTYSAFHPQGFMKKLFKDTEVLEHIEIDPSKGRSVPQDIWIIKKV